MATTNRWQLIVGLIIITGMLVTLAFSVGVYVGKRGMLNQEFERLKNPVPQQNQQKQTLSNRDNAQEGAPKQPDIIGMLEEKSNDYLMISTTQGIKQISITPDTLFISANQNPIKLEDLSRGDIIGIFGNLSPDRGDVFEALLVVKIAGK
ncbi:MAG TPA: hypothetical protein G4N92_04510 [Anaerolineae bacterium]|nr:hypothetical protein [Anaerolineae bacterium]